MDFFYSVLDTAKNSIEERSQQLEQYNTIFGFLYDIHGIKEKCTDLLNACKQLEKSLTQNKDKDIEVADLHYEIKAIARRLPMPMPPQDVLQFILQQKLEDNVPNLTVALRILLTTPVSVASAERSFSKLKLIKTYIRSTMKQERLVGLAFISIENELASTDDDPHLVCLN